LSENIGSAGIAEINRAHALSLFDISHGQIQSRAAGFVAV
jgi:hypothetical protein